MNPCRDHTKEENCPRCRTFDREDPKNLGRSLHFSLTDHIKAVESLIKSDEIEMAFKLLDMVPAWERENYPIALTEIKNTLWQNLYSPMTYVNDEDEAAYTYQQVVDQVNSGYCYPRLDILKALVLNLNAQGWKPWVFELSTSHGPIPIGLKEAGAQFDFYSKNFNQAALAKVIEWMGPSWQPSPVLTQKTIFVNFECLEHAFRVEDIRDDYYKLGIGFDDILLSVPHGTLGGGLPNWETRRLGHVRTYNLKEFSALAMDYFPGYTWKAWPNVSIVLHGTRKSV